MSQSPDAREPMTVQIDGLVILKIMKHSQESLPNAVTGQLLGLDVEGSLEITNCFPVPQKTADDEEGSNEKYQIEMMKCLREANMDYNAVGWYRSTFMGSFHFESMLEPQFSYQENLEKCVVIVFDPMRTSQGQLWIKAYRLTPEFVVAYRERDKSFKRKALARSGLSFENVFEELPMKIHNIGLVQALLHEFEEQSAANMVAPAAFQRLGLTSDTYLEKNLELMADQTQLDEIVSEQQKYLWFEKQVSKVMAKKREQRHGQHVSEEEVLKEVTEPSTLPTLLLSSQVSQYCQQVKEHAEQSMSKLYLLQTLAGIDAQGQGQTRPTYPEFVIGAVAGAAVGADAVDESEEKAE